MVAQGAPATTVVIPAQAGSHIPESSACGTWVPAFAGTTVRFIRSDVPPAAHLHRGLDVVVAHDLAPARDLAFEQRAGGGRRALLLRIGRDPGLRPGLEDCRIGHDLLQRGIEL